MKNILVIGSTGQIGSELTMRLRHEYPTSNVVCGYIKGAEPKGELLESGPAELVDITNPQQIADAVEKYNVDTIYNLAALLSAVAEGKPQLAWKIGVGGLVNCLEVSREKAAPCSPPAPSAPSAPPPPATRPRRTPYSVPRPSTASPRSAESYSATTTLAASA